MENEVQVISIPFDFSDVSLQPAPFPHFVRTGALDLSAAEAVRRWFSEDAVWKSVEGGFYLMSQSRITSARLPSHLAWVAAPETVDYLRQMVASLFGATLGSRVDIDAHRMTPDQRVAIHNDFRPGGETHRLVVGLSPGWTQDDGGLLVLLKGSVPEDAMRAVLPCDGCVTGFEISPRSFHAVTPVTRSVRFTLIYSFYGQE